MTEAEAYVLLVAFKRGLLLIVAALDKWIEAHPQKKQ